MDAQWWTPTTVRYPLTAPTHPTAVLSGTATAKKFWFERQWQPTVADRKSTRLNSSHGYNSYAVFCLKKKKKHNHSQSHE
mgnify:CR=1 FL=1